MEDDNICKISVSISKIMPARPKNTGTRGANTTIVGYGCPKYILVAVYNFYGKIYTFK